MRTEVGRWTYSAIVTVASSSGVFSPAREVTHDGVTYAVCAPGQRFRVVAEVQGFPIGGMERARTTLEVNGNSIGYGYDLSKSFSKATFEGWHAGQNKYTELEFVVPQSDMASSPRSNKPPLGALSVSFKQGASGMCTSHLGHCACCVDHEAWLNGEGVPQAHQRGGPQLQAQSEDKKFFLQPSLGVATTGVTTSGVLGGPSHFESAPGIPKLVLKIHCETEATLILRGILPPRVLLQPKAEGDQNRTAKRRRGNAGATKECPILIQEEAPRPSRASACSSGVLEVAAQERKQVITLE